MSTKKKILELLEKNKGGVLSGERIADLLGISRNAVWKAINELRKDGYEITAATNKGYSLSSGSDIISVEGIRAHLDSGNDINVFDVLESTNITAKEMAISGAEHGTVVIAKKQTGGKGRYARSFASPDGGIYMSFVLRPENMNFENPTTITAFAAVSVCEAIENLTDKSPSIKWVNDVFSDGLKICGISTEAVTDFESGNLEWIVLGIGVNLNTHLSDFPKELEGIVGSLYPNSDSPVTRNEFSAKIIELITRTDLPDETEVFAEYRKRLFMLGKKVQVVRGEETYPATALDINDSGHLILEKEDGETLTLSSGEISITV